MCIRDSPKPQTPNPETKPLLFFRFLRILEFECPSAIPEYF
jgi:hypothetical protein